MKYLNLLLVNSPSHIEHIREFSGGCFIAHSFAPEAKSVIASIFRSVGCSSKRNHAVMWRGPNLRKRIRMRMILRHFEEVVAYLY